MSQLFRANRVLDLDGDDPNLDVVRSRDVA
jgi:hypothetical protein